MNIENTTRQIESSQIFGNYQIHAQQETERAECKCAKTRKDQNE